MHLHSQSSVSAIARYSLRCVSIAIALAVGCGDAETFKTDPGHVDPADVPDDHACLLGATMELSRYSSSCARTGTSLASSVQHGVVFGAEAVRTLTAPCDDGPAPGFDIIFDENSHSLFLDFSKVGADGRFPEAAFEGYTLDLVLQEENGTLFVVSIDREASTLRLGTEDIVWAPDHIDFNLQGIRYDDESLLRLELVFARIPPIEG